MDVIPRVLRLGHVLDEVYDVAEGVERVTELTLATVAGGMRQSVVEGVPSIAKGMLLRLKRAFRLECPVGGPGTAVERQIVFRIVEVIEHSIERDVLIRAAESNPFRWILRWSRQKVERARLQPPGRVDAVW